MEEVIDSFNAALNFALDELSDLEQAIDFLEMWRSGMWSEIAEDYPHFDLNTARCCGYKS